MVPHLKTLVILAKDQNLSFFPEQPPLGTLVLPKVSDFTAGSTTGDSQGSCTISTPCSEGGSGHAGRDARAAEELSSRF